MIDFLGKIINLHITQYPSLPGIFKNIGWMSIDSAIRFVLGFIITVWMARSYGPDGYGHFSYAMTFVAVFIPFALLGLEQIVIRAVVREPQARNEIFGSAFFLRLGAGLIVFGLIEVIIFWGSSCSLLDKLLISFIAAGLVFQSVDVIDFYFKSLTLSKYSVVSKNIVLICFAIIKVFLLIRGVSLTVFAGIVFLESVAMAGALVVTYYVSGAKIHEWKASFSVMKKLLMESWPIFLSGLFVAVYTKIDQLLVSWMLGHKTLGIYSSALRVSEMWYWVPMAVVASAFPTILKYSKDGKFCDLHVQKILDVLVPVSILFALFVTATASWLIRIIFGAPYVEAVILLRYHVWSGVFVSLVVVSAHWLIAARLERYLWKRSLFGAMASTCFCLILIHGWGAVGAAIASVLAYAIPIIIIGLIPETRLFFIMALRSFDVFRIWRIFLTTGGCKT